MKVNFVTPLPCGDLKNTPPARHSHLLGMLQPRPPFLPFWLEPTWYRFWLLSLEAFWSRCLWGFLAGICRWQPFAGLRAWCILQENEHSSNLNDSYSWPRRPAMPLCQPSGCLLCNTLTPLWSIDKLGQLTSHDQRPPITEAATTGAVH